MGSGPKLGHQAVLNGSRNNELQDDLTCVNFHLSKSLKCYIHYTDSWFFLYIYLYFWLVRSQDEAIGIIWVAAQKGCGALTYANHFLVYSYSPCPFHSHTSFITILSLCILGNLCFPIKTGFCLIQMSLYIGSV